MKEAYKYSFRKNESKPNFALLLHFLFSGSGTQYNTNWINGRFKRKRSPHYNTACKIAPFQVPCDTSAVFAQHASSPIAARKRVAVNIMGDSRVPYDNQTGFRFW